MLQRQKIYIHEWEQPHIFHMRIPPTSDHSNSTYPVNCRVQFKLIILLFGLYNEPANSILSENTPKNNQITPIYDEKTVPKPASPKTKASVQMPEEKKLRNQTERTKEKQKKDLWPVLRILRKNREYDPLPLPRGGRSPLSQIVKLKTKKKKTKGTLTVSSFASKHLKHF